MSGRDEFTPKDSMRLRDAIEAIGRATEPEWTGHEQTPENWQLVDPEHRRGERLVRLWLQVMGNLIAACGHEFRRAAEDYWLDSRDHPDDAADLERFTPVYVDRVRGLLGADADAATVEMLHAARRVCIEAILWRQNRKLAESGFRGERKERFHCNPPALLLPGRRIIMGISDEELSQLEQGVDRELDQLEGERRPLRERVERVWDRLRPELHAGTYECFVLTTEGVRKPLPATVWARPEARTLLGSCNFEDREIFAPEAMCARGFVARVSSRGGRPSQRSELIEFYRQLYGPTDRPTRKEACKAIAEAGGPDVHPDTLSRALKENGLI